MQERDQSSPDAGDESDEQHRVEAPSSEPPAEPTDSEQAESDTSEPAAEPTGDEDLPEWEPLTPELVEDEAIRGDFMLRWASILLALLMGWTIIQDTSVLTHIKTGQYLADHGFLPPATDVFSSSAADHRWVNLSWLWDLTIAGVYGIGGSTGVSIFKALLAAAIFWVLSRISVPELPTWWGSVCGVLALLSAFPSLTATPEIVTLLGMACLMWLLHVWTLESGQRSLWLIVVLLLVWCQFDDRAWIGAVTLLGFTIGHWLDGWRKLEDARPAGVKPLVLVSVAGVLAMLIHPFGWETLRSGVALYKWEYPALQQYANSDVPYLYEYYSLWSSGFWRDINYFNAAGMLLWLITLVVLALNRDQLRLSHVAVFVVMTVISFAGGRELAAAGIVNAVLATLNAQQWYRTSFRQSYSIETNELLFSRGGRALTVVAFFALGFVMVSGHLTGADGRRVGGGLDPQLEQTIASYRQVLEDSYDDRAFNFLLFQGDVLIWIGQKPFIDSRLRLFAAGPSPVIEEHLALRPTLRKPSDESSTEQNRRLWQAGFDQYGITHVLPRLSGTSPDYVTFRDLNQSTDWTLTRLGAATAVFYRADSSAGELRSYVDEHSATDVVSGVFRSRKEQSDPPVQRIEWPRPPTIYDRYLYLPYPVTPNILQEALHDSMLVRQRVIAQTRDNLMATSYAAIRKIHACLADNPHNQLAYIILADSYGVLQQAEQSAMNDTGAASTRSFRTLQIISAYHHALLCNPDSRLAGYSHYRLSGLFFAQQKKDLALHHLQQLQDISGRLTTLPETDPESFAEQERNNEVMLVLTADEAEMRRSLEEQLAAGENRLSLVEQLVESGYLLAALETLEDDITIISGNPGMSRLYGQILLEVGRTEEAHDQFQSLKGLADQVILSDWHVLASIGEMVAEDLTGAVATSEREYEQLGVLAAANLMQAAPLRSSGPNGPADDHHRTDPLRTVSRQTSAAMAYLSGLLPRLEDNLVRRALISLEIGDNAEAEKLFRSLLQRGPETEWRPLAEMYLSLLTDGTDIPPAPAEDEVDALVLPLVDDESAPADSPDDPTDTKEPSEEDNADRKQTSPPAAKEDSAAATDAQPQ